jgi:chemotaxis protein methyltransferase CheR
MTTVSRTSEPAAEGIGFPRMHASFTATLSAEAYRKLSALVYQHSRIHLGPDKQPMLANRLRKRLRVLGLTSYDDYCAVLQAGPGADEIEQLVDLISTNHTRFFREPEHFTFLTDRLLPALVPQLAAEGSSLRVWSAAASSGEEPYTLAIVLAEFFRAHASVDWQVEASDISHRMLDQAERGIYPLDNRHALSPELLHRYFQQGVGVHAGNCRVKAALRDRVQFQRINLFQAEYPVARGQHVVFCRNVMIYFDPPSRATLVQKLTRQLAPGGYLVIGHAESLLGIRHDLEPVRQSIYRKP